jgi:hypothetical protein
MLDLLEIGSAQLILAGQHRLACIGVDDIPCERSALCDPVGVPPKVAEFAELWARQRARAER